MWSFITNGDIMTICGIFVFLGMITGLPFIFCVIAGWRLGWTVFSSFVIVLLLLWLYYELVVKHFGGMNDMPNYIFVRIIFTLGSIVAGYALDVIIMALIPYHGLISFSFVKEIPVIPEHTSTYRFTIRRAGTTVQPNNLPRWEKIEKTEKKPAPIIVDGHKWTQEVPKPKKK